MAILFLFAIFLDTGSFLFLDGHRRSLHQDVGSVSSRVQNTFWEVFTGVFKLCVWVLHMRPLNFTFQLLQFDQKKLRDHALFSTFLCSKTIQQNCFRYDQSQSNVPLGHPYWFFFIFFFHVHKTAWWRWGTLHSPEVVNTVDPLLSYCQFAFIVIVPDSCLCFISCLGANRGDAIT